MRGEWKTRKIGANWQLVGRFGLALVVALLVALGVGCENPTNDSGGGGQTATPPPTNQTTQYRLTSCDSYANEYGRVGIEFSGWN